MTGRRRCDGRFVHAVHFLPRLPTIAVGHWPINEWAVRTRRFFGQYSLLMCQPCAAPICHRNLEMTYRAPVADIAFALRRAAGFAAALNNGLYGDLGED